MPDFWGRGIGNECCKELLKYLHTTKWTDGLDKIVTLIHRKNVAGIKIVLKNSFIEDKDQLGTKVNYIRYTFYL